MNPYYTRLRHSIIRTKPNLFADKDEDVFIMKKQEFDKATLENLKTHEIITDELIKTGENYDELFYRFYLVHKDGIKPKAEFFPTLDGCTTKMLLKFLDNYNAYAADITKEGIKYVAKLKEDGSWEIL